MIVGVLREPAFESRVSLLAEGVAVLVKKKLEVWVQTGAGVSAYCSDAAYTGAGALIRSREEMLAAADLLLGIHYDDIPADLQNKILVGEYQPLFNPAVMAGWARQGITSFSLDLLPRAGGGGEICDPSCSRPDAGAYECVVGGGGCQLRQAARTGAGQ